MFDSDIIGPFGEGMARLERWVLDPQRRTTSVTVIDETPNEFPRHRGSAHRQAVPLRLLRVAVDRWHDRMADAEVRPRGRYA